MSITAGLTAGLTTGPAAMGRVTHILRTRCITAIRSDRGEGKIPMVPSRLLLLRAAWSLVVATVPHHNTGNGDEYQRKQPPSTHTESNHQRLICSAGTTTARRPAAVPARLYRPIVEAQIRSAEAGQPIVGSVPGTTAQCPHAGDRVPAFRCHIPKSAACFAGGSARVVASQYVEEQVAVVVDVRVDPPEPPALEGMGADSGEQGC